MFTISNKEETTMKKRIALLVLCLSLLVQFPVFAYGGTEYGESLKLLPMKGVFPSVEFWNMYAGREACGYTEEQAYMGGTSLKVDVVKLKQTQKKILNFETQKVKLAQFGANKDSLYFEWYLYGLDTDVFANRLVFSATFYSNDTVTTTVRNGINYEKMENGWVKVWTTVSKEVYKDADSCTMGILYNPQKEGSVDVDCFYLDEMAIRIIPGNLYIQDITAESTVDLDVVRVFGLDCFNNKKLVNIKSILKWSVVSGEAVIDNNQLVYTGKNNSSVVVKCDCYNVTTEFTVDFKKKISYGELSTNSDGSMSVIVQNKSNENTEIELIYALYDDERLYSIQTEKKNVAGKSQEEIKSKPIRISDNIKKPIIKVYSWDSFGGMSVLK